MISLNTLARSTAALAILVLTQAAHAQAPAGAPAGASGICKDGTYSTAASKDGACRGHKGVQTWYSATAPSASGTTTNSSSRRSKSAGTGSTAPSPAMLNPGPAASPSMPAPAQASSPAPMPMPAPRASMPAPRASMPAPQAQPAQPAPASGRSNISSERAKLTNMQPATGGGPGLVWVNGSSKVYHCQGSEFYGKTKTGAYMSESDAKAKGAHADHGKPCN